MEDPEIQTVTAFLRNAHECVVQSCLVSLRMRGEYCYDIHGCESQEQVTDMKIKIAKHYEETWAEKESEYKERIEKQEVRCVRSHGAVGHTPLR